MALRYGVAPVHPPFPCAKSPTLLRAAFIKANRYNDLDDQPFLAAELQADIRSTMMVRGLRSVCGRRQGAAAGHLEGVSMSGQPVAMALAADTFVRCDQTRLPDFGGIEHDLGRPVVAPRAMTGLALNSGQSGGPGAMAWQTGGRLSLEVQALGSPGVSGRLPAYIDGSVTELAPLRTDEGGLVDAQGEKTRHEDQPGRTAIIRLHPLLSNRLAQANPRRQGFGNAGPGNERGERGA